MTKNSTPAPPPKSDAAGIGPAAPDQSGAQPIAYIVTGDDAIVPIMEVDDPRVGIDLDSAIMGTLAEAHALIETRRQNRVLARFRKERVIEKVARERVAFLQKHPQKAEGVRAKEALLRLKHPERRSRIEERTAEILDASKAATKR